MRRIVVDPGVLFSAALSPMGNPSRIIEAVRSGRVVLIVSPHLLAELDSVLGRPKIETKLDPGALSVLRHVLAAAPAAEDPVAVPVSRDPKDDYLVALARQAGADCIVSGDADLTVLDDLEPPMRSPAAFLAELDA